MKKLLLVVAGLVVLALLAVGGFFVLNNYVYNEKQPKEPAPDIIISFEDCVRAGHPILDSSPEQCETPNGLRFVDGEAGAGDTSVVIAEGELVCLPHRDTSGPTTQECAFGLQTDAGEYYALRNPDPSAPTIGATPTGTRIQVTGSLTADQSDTYQSVGIIEARDVIEL